MQVVSERAPDRGRVARALVRLEGLQARALQRDRDLPRPRHDRHRRRPDEPRRLGPRSRSRRPATASRAPCSPPTPTSRSPTGPSWRWTRASTAIIQPGGSVRDPDRRGRRRGRRRDGVHRPPPLPALSRPMAMPRRSAGRSAVALRGRLRLLPRRRRGRLVLVGGTTSVDADGFVIGETPVRADRRDPAQAAARALPRRRRPADDVLQTRVYVTDISRADEVGRAHGEVFGDDPPADDDGRDLRPDRPADARRDRSRGLRVAADALGPVAAPWSGGDRERLTEEGGEPCRLPTNTELKSGPGDRLMGKSVLRGERARVKSSARPRMPIRESRLAGKRDKTRAARRPRAHKHAPAAHVAKLRASREVCHLLQAVRTRRGAEKGDKPAATAG